MNSTTWVSGLCGALLALAAGPAVAEWSAEIGLEARGFFNDPLFPDQQHSSGSVRLLPSYWHDWDDGDQRFAAELFFRADSADSERTHADLREFYWRRSFSAAELSIGLRRVFWGVTESVHLVDIINQTDFVENIDTEDKLGQPMVHLSLLKDWGTLDFFVMPWFRERTFAGSGGRLRPPVPVDTDNPIYESSAEQNHIDLAVRWSHYIGDYDIGLAHFSGTAREPRFMPSLDDTGSLVIRPFYQQLEQTSLDLQATKGSWLWKVEAVSRRELGSRSTGVVAGFEYTLVGAFGSVIDLGFITEYLFDDRGKTLAIGDNDVALGVRLAFNDVQSTELLAFSAIDLDNGGGFTSVEGSRRLGQNYRLSLEARFFSGLGPEELIFSVRDDDYVELELTRFF
ncbi:MAG: hypothetical protein AAFN78_14815 [Pseudomonadota bacterium]